MGILRRIDPIALSLARIFVSHPERRQEVNEQLEKLPHLQDDFRYAFLEATRHGVRQGRGVRLSKDNN